MLACVGSDDSALTVLRLSHPHSPKNFTEPSVRHLGVFVNPSPGQVHKEHRLQRPVCSATGARRNGYLFDFVDTGS